MSEPQPTARPTLTANDPPGWYECRNDYDSSPRVFWFDGEFLWSYPAGIKLARPRDYTDFLPLGVQPAGRHICFALDEKSTESIQTLLRRGCTFTEISMKAPVTGEVLTMILPRTETASSATTLGPRM